MNIQVLLEKCLATSPREEKINGSRVKHHVETPYYTYCDLFAPSEEKDPESDYLELLNQKGTAHEYEIVQKLIPNVIVNDIDNILEGFKTVLHNMGKGIKYLTGFPLIYETHGFRGFIDILIRDNTHSSVFGDYHYTIGEVKIAKHIKDKHILQAMFYNKTLGLIQEYTPEHVQLINGEGKWEIYIYNDYKPKLEAIITEIRAIQSKKYVPLPVFKECPPPWTSYSNKMAWKTKDLTCLPGIGSSTRAKLIHLASSIEDLYHVSKEDIEAIKGFGAKTAKKLKLYSEAITENKNIKIKIGKPRLPNVEIELYIDFEGVDPTNSPIKWTAFDFLFGVIIYHTKTGRQEFKAPLIRDPLDYDEVIAVVNEFLDILDEHPRTPIYHWAPYEKTSLKRIAKLYHLEDRVKKIIPRLKDLYKITENSWVFPLSSLSIKAVAPYLGFSWRGDEMQGRKAIAMYLEYLLKEERFDSDLQDVIDYNEDDIKAMIFIKEWLDRNELLNIS